MVLRSLAALAVPLVLLVSCTNDDPDPILAPSASATPTSEEPSPTASATEEPESPEDFIARWVQLNNTMQASGDTDAYRDVSDECGPCRDFADQIQDIYSGGGFVETKGWRIMRIGSSKGPATNPTFDVEIDSRPTTSSRSEGSKESSLPGGRITERFELKQIDGEWTISNMSQVAS